MLSVESRKTRCGMQLYEPTPDLPNPCDSAILRKIFRAAKYPQREMLDKETVGEDIFKIPQTRNRLIVELSDPNIFASVGFTAGRAWG